jgi:hypothetical protein
MADVIFNFFKYGLLKGTFGDLSAGGTVVKCMLVTSGYSPDQDAHDYIDDVGANEVSGTGYTAGGATLANKAVTQDNTDNEGVLDADDVSWTSSTITARGAILYKDTGTPATSPMICYFDFASDKSSTNGTFQIQWNTEGIINLT